MKSFSPLFIRVAALYALIGAVIGSHMAGSKDYSLVPAHGHILVVGWLSLFAIGIFYWVFPNFSWPKVGKVQAWTTLVGAAFMPWGMMAYYKFGQAPWTLIAFIAPAVLLLIGFALLAVIVLFDKALFKK